MDIDKSKKTSMRKSFGSTLAELGAKNKDIVVLDADLACSTQTQIFKDKFPDRFFDCGISEQDMIATSAGLASQGKIPFAASFAVFATGRAYDQVRNSVCYPKFNVKIIGTHGGITVGEDGATHQALEDISLMRGLPNMTVIVPADSKECSEAVKFAASYKGPVYIRVSRASVMDIFDENYKFNINKAPVLKEGSGMTVLSNGETTAQVLLAAQELAKEGIDIEVINVPVVKPLDTETILNSVKKTNLAVTVENHSIIGGLGSAVCETLSSEYPAKVYRIGINDQFGQSGKADELMAFYGLDAEHLIKRLKAVYQKEKGQN